MVYDAALKANALGFIELDERSDAIMKEQIEKEFLNKIREMRQEYPDFARGHEELKQNE